jgi:hypothetical protein
MMNTNNTSHAAEHHFRKVIPGNIETVRQRLCDVLEDFGYIVLSENPLQARRPAKHNMVAANVLEYDTQLTIALKSLSPASTVATFDYHLTYLFANSERLALEREADAIIALATMPMKKSVCPACDTENAGGVRFCRACGTPIARSKLPAELEVMRLMAGGSAAQVEINWGVTLAILTLLIALPMILLGKPKLVAIGGLLLAIGELLAAFYLLWGMRRLHRTLNANQPAQPESSPEELKGVSATERNLLPPTPASVTEGTTELMDPQTLPTSAKPTKTTGALD